MTGNRLSTPARARSRDTRAVQQRVNGAVHEQIAELQRMRILGATLDVSAQRGAGSVTVAHVVERSGVSRRTFYERFTDREDCLLAAFEQALRLAVGRVVPAYEAEKGWRERIRAGLVEFLAFCDEQPSVGRMLVCESLAGGPLLAARRTDVIAALTKIVDEGRTLTGAGGSGESDTVSQLAAEGVVGGALTVIQARMLARNGQGRARPVSLLSLTNELTSMIVLPYLGPAAARRELDHPAPAASRTGGDGVLLMASFKDAGMRLTYRTVRVLMAIAEHPQASNREIGQSAGIADQGQISKLLSRLERLGFVQNTHLHPGRGAPNSWALTENGRRMTDGIKAHTEGLR